MNAGISPGLKDQIGPTLGECARIWRQKVNERLRPLGLSQGSWRVLWFLAQAPEGLVQGELAERMGIEGPTLVRLLDLLAREGLVERQTPHQDRRRRLVGLTEKAGPIVLEVKKIIGDLRGEIMDAMPEDELRDGLAFLQRIQERLNGL